LGLALATLIFHVSPTTWDWFRSMALWLVLTMERLWRMVS